MSLAVSIRRGCEEEASQQASVGAGRARLRHLRAQAAAGELSRLAWDQLLLELVLSYRRGSKAEWAPVLLEALAPAMANRLRIFRPVWPLISDDDIAQQLVTEVLLAADSIPLGVGSRWVDRRLLLRACNRVSRWLLREAGAQSRRAELR